MSSFQSVTGNLLKCMRNVHCREFSRMWSSLMSQGHHYQYNHCGELKFKNYSPGSYKAQKSQRRPSEIFRSRGTFSYLPSPTAQTQEKKNSISFALEGGRVWRHRIDLVVATCPELVLYIL